MGTIEVADVPIPDEDVPVLATFIRTCEALGIGPSAERLTAYVRLPEHLRELMVHEVAASKRARERSV